MGLSLMPRAPLWSWLVTALAASLFVALGAWQAGKGRTKQALQATLADRDAPALALSAAAAPPAGLELRRASAMGTYLADRQLLQDGQSHAHRPGNHVWTPLRLADGALVLVNRGWVPQGASDLAAPAGVATVRGFWRALPEPGLRLEATQNCPAQKKFPAPVLYPTAAEVTCLLGEPVLPGVLLLDPDIPGGYVREWSDFGFPPQRHYAYAFQWLALALAAVVIFLVVNRKRA
jgi:surfeit locus 1 family protein